MYHRREGLRVPEELLELELQDVLGLPEQLDAEGAAITDGV